MVELIEKLPQLAELTLVLLFNDLSPGAPEASSAGR